MRLLNWRVAISGVLLSVGLAACSSTEEPDYAELQTFEEQVSVNVAWKANVGPGSDEHYSRLAPVYDDGVVFAAERHGNVVALNADNGRRLWRQDLTPATGFSLLGLFRKGPPAKLAGGLTLDGDTLYVGNESGMLYAINKDNGEIQWQSQLEGEVISAPAVGEGYVVLHLGNGMVVSLNAADGEEQWRHEEEVPALTLRGSSSPVISAGGVILGTNNGRAAVLVLESGQMAWDERVATPSGGSDLERIVDIDATPVVRGDQVYMLAFNGELVALELRTGEVVWRRDYQGHRTPQVAGSRIFLTTSESHVVAVDRLSGNESWRSADLYGRSLTEPAVLSGQLVVADRFGFVHWLDRDSGQMMGRYEASDPIQVAPIRAGDKVIVMTIDGRLVALTD
ncbi:outer membrane protein assembly factor BamB [Aliidiomarina sedimenti]|uniref:outer membrane protein assembly factor BamB n=1 Tax=Aliidiomarina sedimenti TaxID=1933879 RepID=UPI0013004326|nr:outer membrane protein assembly factor BamB [Aliidiomarina sedimenti]